MSRTYCVNCRHLHSTAKGQHPALWLCTRHPNISERGFGFVTDNTWDRAEPYLRCKDVNGGACPLFEPEDGPQMRLDERSQQ